MTPGAWSIWTPEAWFAVGLMFSEKILDPRGMVGRIYVGDHKTFLHTKYVSCGPHGFREEDFLSFFSIISL